MLGFIVTLFDTTPILPAIKKEAGDALRVGSGTTKKHTKNAEKT